MSKFRIEEVTEDSEWDCFVNASPQGSIFSLSRYLKLAVDNYKRYWILKGNQIKAGLSLVLNAEGTKCILDDLVIYNGIMFVYDETKKEAKSRLERFEITEYIINYLDSTYLKIELALSPQFEDIRPFLWHNYHHTDRVKKFTTDLRYTSYIDISSFIGSKQEEQTILFKNLETLRQRNIREARKVGSESVIGKDTEQFLENYQTLLTNQGDIQQKEKIYRMKRLINGLINANEAILINTINPHGIPIYTTIYGWDKKRAYYLFGSPNPETNERYKGTASFWDGFKLLANDGISEVDLEGVNSPQRGWFKLSLGGNLLPYYEVYR